MLLPKSVCVVVPRRSSLLTVTNKRQPTGMENQWPEMLVAGDQRQTYAKAITFQLLSEKFHQLPRVTLREELRMLSEYLSLECVWGTLVPSSPPANLNYPLRLRRTRRRTEEGLEEGRWAITSGGGMGGRLLFSVRNCDTSCEFLPYIQTYPLTVTPVRDTVRIWLLTVDIWE